MSTRFHISAYHNPLPSGQPWIPPLLGTSIQDSYIYWFGCVSSFRESCGLFCRSANHLLNRRWHWHRHYFHQFVHLHPCWMLYIFVSVENDFTARSGVCWGHSIFMASLSIQPHHWILVQKFGTFGTFVSDSPVISLLPEFFARPSRSAWRDYPVFLFHIFLCCCKEITGVFKIYFQVVILGLMVTSFNIRLPFVIQSLTSEDIWFSGFCLLRILGYYCTKLWWESGRGYGVHLVYIAMQNKTFERNLPHFIHWVGL